jgi:Protein of unknown function (DUF3558)
MRPPLLVRIAAITGLCLVVLVGIALTSSGSPIFTANDPATPPPTHGFRTVTAPPTTTTISLPPRPGDLPLTGLNPCKILSTAQRAALHLDDTPTPYTDAEFDHAKACTIRGIASGAVARLALVTDMGVDVWLSDTAQVSAAPVTVAGYPALVVRTPGLTDACNVEVDAADGQFLDVLYRDGGNTPPIPQDQLCQGAQQVATDAVTSLQKDHR